MTPIGKVANSVVPKSLSSSYKPQLEKYVEIKKEIDLDELNDLKKIAPKQYLVYKAPNKIICLVKFLHSKIL